MRITTLAAFTVLTLQLAAASNDDQYVPGPDSQKQPGVPAGKTFQFKFTESKVFPGTTRTISVYVPAEYKADKPACLYVGLDGLGFNAPIVFDNLIHKGDMPVTIGVGISPGQVESAAPPADPRFNRSFEFDGLNDNLARLVVDEVLPAVESKKTPDGLPILISKSPDDRCTGGGSTGAIAAFTLAWERPDSFHRVFTAIGTFVGMRGGDRYPVLVRKTEPKPIRIFMQDGSNDEWMGGPEVGDWWMSNQTMERALSFSGYQVEHAWGEGSHNGKHPTMVFPDAMRFLWKGYPEPVKPGESQNLFLKAILQPGEEWQAREEPLAGWLGADDHGEVHGQMAHIGDIQAQGFTNVRSDVIYITGTLHNDGNVRLWLVSGPRPVQLDEGLKDAPGVALSPDHLWLAVAEAKSHWGYSYKVNPDGTVADKQKFYWFHVPDTADDAGVGQICFDRDGRLYAATRMGVQVLDRNGRVRAILPLPDHSQATGVCFGGEKFDTLYVAAAGKLWKRKMKSTALPPGAAPIKLPPWGAG